MKPSQLKPDELFIFKKRDPFRQQLDGIICKSLGGGRFVPALKSHVTFAFHHKDRVKKLTCTGPTA